MGKKTLLRRVAALVCAATLAFGMVGVLSACGESSGSSGGNASSDVSASATRIFTDSCGREVELPATVERVAVSGPVSQQVFLTFAPDLLVGLATEIDDKTAKYVGVQYADLPVYGQIYGGKGDLNKEAVASADPQVIVDIGEAKSTVSEDMDALQEQLGVPCVHIEATLSTYDEAYTMLGELTGLQDKGAEMATYCRTAYDTTVAGLDKVTDKVSGLYVVGVDGLSVIAKDSYQAQVVDMVIDNLAVLESPSAKGTGNEVSMEQIALWAPDFIVFGESTYDTMGDLAEWADIPAIANNNYIDTPLAPYNWLSNPPSVNQLLGLQWFARTLYPEQFTDSVQDVVTSYYKLFYNYDMSESEYAEFIQNSTL